MFTSTSRKWLIQAVAGHGFEPYDFPARWRPYIPWPVQVVVHRALHKQRRRIATRLWYPILRAIEKRRSRTEIARQLALPEDVYVVCRLSKQITDEQAWRPHLVHNIYPQHIHHAVRFVPSDADGHLRFARRLMAAKLLIEWGLARGLYPAGSIFEYPGGPGQEPAYDLAFTGLMRNFEAPTRLRGYGYPEGAKLVFEDYTVNEEKINV